MKFGERLKDLRLEKKIKVVDLARAAGVSQAAIYSFERNERYPTTESVVKLARYFGVTTDYLLGEKDF